MSSLKAQTEAKVAETRKAKPEFMQKIDALMAEAKAFQQGGKAIAIDQSAPNFTLPNAEGKAVSLAELLEKGSVVVTFYRGSWCPYCNLQLKALHNRLSEIHELGAELVAISPEVPDDSLTKTDIATMGFEVLSDQGASVASEYDIAWEVPEVLLEHMKVDRNLDLAVVNNGNGTILPIPATFIINREGKVVWRYVDVDYRTRSEPEDIINALKSLA